MTFQKRLCQQCIYAYYHPREVFPIRQCLKFEVKNGSKYLTTQECRKDETKCGTLGLYWFRKTES
jgi:hypothetical protein